MKIVRPEPASPVPIPSRKLKSALSFNRWYVQAVLLLAAFVAGALVYRSGIVRPMYSFLRQAAAGELRQLPLPEGLGEVTSSISDEIRLYQNNGLPTLYIDLPFEGYQQILEKREEALKLGILNTTNADFVNAAVRLQDGPTLDADIRLKGDWTDHLAGDKWSFRIDLKEEGHIQHMREFSVQSPATRNFLYEWAFHKNLIEEGLLTTRYSFVNVLLNGKLLGVYALEESFATELMESQGRREGVIIRFDEDLMWQNMTTFWSRGVVQEGNFMITTLESADITAFQDARIAANPILASEAETARGLLRAFQTGQRPAAEVFDVPLMGRFFAMHDLWSACHGVAWHNPRFYYNPVTGLLEPVAYDAEPFAWCSTEQTIIGEFTHSKLFDDPHIRAAYARELERLTQPGYVAHQQEALAAEHDALQEALEAEFRGQDVFVDWQALEERAGSLSLELQPAQTARGVYQLLNSQPGAAGRPELAIDLVNLLLLPIEVERVEVNGQAAPVDQAPVALDPARNAGSQAFHPVRITATLPDIEVPVDGVLRVEVITRMTGLEREFRVPVSGGTMPEGTATGPAPAQPTLEEVLGQHTFLESKPAEPGSLLVSPGVWDVTGDLILPAHTNLFVPAGTVLRFAKDSILYATGQVHLLGSPTAPVVLTAQQDGWGGLVVLNAGPGSVWQHALVEKTTGISREGWILTGGITFFRSDIALDHVLLGSNQTEDAINVIHGTFQFHNSEFANTFADAFDGDFASGEIVNCYFHDIAGDAVDVSGADASMTNSRLERIGDKGVSVGEQSRFTITKVTMDTVGIGVASKDLSEAVIQDSEIRAARFSALTAYIKKPVYGPARIEAANLTITGTNKPAVAQTGSQILIDGQPVATVDIDVEALYEQGILGN